MHAHAWLPLGLPLGLPLLFLLAAPSAAWAGASDTPRPQSNTTVPRPAQPDPAALCETAITTAEYQARLPPRLLGAIGLTETGRIEPVSGRVRPWPWAINAQGAGQYFETRQQAVVAVKELLARGVRSIDVGCLQVNLMYHPDAFATLDAAFDPHLNATYAARFLNTLHAASKTWAHAIAAYHSETPALGDAYRKLVMARWQNPNLRGTLPVRTAYADFQQSEPVYAAFAPVTRVYGAFATPENQR